MIPYHLFGSRFINPLGYKYLKLYLKDMIIKIGGKINFPLYFFFICYPGYKVRCFILTTPLEVAHHLNYMRQAQTEGEVRRIPNVAYNMYKKNFEKPDKKEGFDDILEIPFVPVFNDDKNKKLFLQWTQD